MELEPGDRIGHYEVRDLLGKGGMGQVYRARDTRLNRDVALKVLPELSQADPDRLARFTREAQTLAALNHPNIAQIHGLEENPAGQRTVRALAMELVDGEDLSTIINRGPLALRDALPIARQIADALEAAHELGIIHRDLKPANIKVRADGTVKVLDFGLAKAMAPDVISGTDPMNSPTLTAHATQLGMILGTAAYMAPEQARGKVVDRRADVWAFGVVLYEMLTGTRAFEGDDISVTLASVLKDDPHWERLPADLPPSVDRLLRRCLEKEPKRRLSAIGDARLDLDEQTPLPAVQASTQRRSLSWAFSALGGAVAAAIVAVVLWPGAGAAPDTRLTRLSILPPPGERLYPDSTGVAISPDGTMVAFIVGAVARSESELWVRDLHSLQSRRLEGGNGAQLVFWSPDSRRIGFFALGKIKSIAAAGGRAEIICDCEAPGGRGAIWTPSNVIVFAPDAGGPLFRVAATGGTPEAVTTIDPARKEYSHRFPALLPDGVHFLYASLPGRNGRFDIFAGSLNDSSRTFIGSLDAAPVYAAPGWLLYARQGLLNAVKFDPAALKITGEPVALDDEPAMILDPATAFTAGRSVSLSNTGAVAYYSSPSVNTVATWYDATGVPLGTLNLPPGHYESIAISPDGSRGVLVRSTSPSESSLWLTDMARGGTSPLAAGPGRNDSPLWSPDGTRVAFSGDREGFQTIFVKNVNDASPEQPLYTSDAPFKNAASWSPDGRWVVLTQLDPATAQNVWLVDASGGKTPTILVRGATRDNAGPVSPDGRWLGFFADDSGRFELFVQPFPEPGPRVQVSDKGAVTAWWRRDARELVFLGDDLRSLWRVDVQAGPRFTVAGTPRRFAMLPPDVVFVAAMPDLQRFVAIAPQRTGTGSITVVQNWPAAIAR